MDRFKLAGLWCLLIIVLVVLAQTAIRSVSPGLAKFLIVRERAVKSDAIVLLLGGAAMERPRLAKALYGQGIAKQIIFCDGFEVGGWKAWWYRARGWIPSGKVTRNYLIGRDVPYQALKMIPCPHVHDTASEIRVLSRYLVSIHARSAVLVTSASHSRRAQMAWKRLSPTIRARVIGARDAQLRRWWSSRRGRSTVLYEYLALLKEIASNYVSLSKIYPATP